MDEQITWNRNYNMEIGWKTDDDDDSIQYTRWDWEANESTIDRSEKVFVPRKLINICIVKIYFNF